MAVLLLLFGAALFGIHTAAVPAISKPAPEGSFDVALALQHLKAITVEPHPPGSKAHRVVQDYLLGALRSAGLDAEVQAMPFIYPERGNPFPAGDVENVVGRIPGTAGDDAILVVGHYDSVPSGPGASDDGAAVAAMLTAARLIGSGPAPKNDLIFLFSDAEEAGLLGARAFAVRHPLMNKVRVVLNFEARGTSGPSLMFETGRRNGWIVDRFASAVSHPLSSSLFQEVYRRLPNDTDFSAFRSFDLAGLNFAYIEGLLHYHTALDNVEHLDPRSLAHHGENLVALVRKLGSASLASTKAEDQAYFNLGPLFVHCPLSWARAITGATVLIFAAALGVMLRRRSLRTAGLLVGFGALWTVASAAALSCYFFHCGVVALHPSYRALPQGDIYNGILYLGAYQALAFALWSASMRWLARRWAQAELTAGALCGWAVLALISIIAAPGASYIFTIPLLCGTGALRELSWARAPRPFVIGLAAVPTVALLAPLVWSLYVALTLQLAAATVLLAVFGFAATPAFGVVAGNSLRAPAGAAAIAVVLLLVGSAASGFDREHPRPVGVTYVLDADSHKALFAASQREPVTAKLAGSTKEPSYQSRPEYFPTWGTVWVADAPVLELVPPRVELVRDEVKGATRVLWLRIQSQRAAPLIEIQVSYEVALTGILIAGTRLGREALRRQGYGADRLVIQYWVSSNGGFEVGFELPVNQPLQLRVGDTTFVQARRAGGAVSMPMGFGLPDATLVTKMHRY